MIYTKKYRHKPIYKKFVKLKANVQNRNKLNKYKKTKWKNLLFHFNKLNKHKKRNCYYKFYDQHSYTVLKYNNFFSRNYKQKVIEKKRLNLFYGSLSEIWLKTKVNKSEKKSNQIKNQIKSNFFLMMFLEQRLDIIITRSHFVLSVRNARQLILHGHVLVNNKITKDYSKILKKSDMISFSPKVHKLIQYYVASSSLWPLPPSYLQISYKIYQIQVIEDLLLSSYSYKFFYYLNLNNILKSYKK